MKSLRHITLILAVALMPLFLSCEFASSETNDIDIWIICTGAYTFDLIIDNKVPLSNIGKTGTFIIPAGDISKATISVTRIDPADSVTLAIYNHNEFDDNGYANLEACASGVTTCSNTLSLQYEVKSTTETDGTAAASTSESSTTTE